MDEWNHGQRPSACAGRSEIQQLKRLCHFWNLLRTRKLQEDLSSPTGHKSRAVSLWLQRWLSHVWHQLYQFLGKPGEPMISALRGSESCLLKQGVYYFKEIWIFASEVIWSFTACLDRNASIPLGSGNLLLVSKHEGFCWNKNKHYCVNNSFFLM